MRSVNTTCSLVPPTPPSSNAPSSFAMSPISAASNFASTPRSSHTYDETPPSPSKRGCHSHKLHGTAIGSEDSAARKHESAWDAQLIKRARGAPRRHSLPVTHVTHVATDDCDASPRALSKPPVAVQHATTLPQLAESPLLTDGISVADGLRTSASDAPAASNAISQQADEQAATVDLAAPNPHAGAALSTGAQTANASVPAVTPPPLSLRLPSCTGHAAVRVNKHASSKENERQANAKAQCASCPAVFSTSSAR